MANPARETLAEQVVSGLFRDRNSAERAYALLLARGYDKSAINVVMSQDTRERLFPTNSPASDLSSAVAARADELTPGAALGGPIGGTVGTLAPVVAAVGTALLMPGLVIAGPIAIALAAAGVAGVAGGVVGALVHWGIPSERTEEYEAGVRDGGVLLGVTPHSAEDSRRIQREWRELGGKLVHA